MSTTTGLEGFGGTDMVVPTYKLFQATSSDIPGIDKELAVGDFFDGTNKINRKKGFKVVLLAAVKKRLLYWDEKKDGPGKKGRRCWSDDGVKPSPKVEFPVSDGDCSVCQYRNQDEEYHMTFLDVDLSLESGSPVVFKFVSKGTSNFATRTLLTSLVRSKKAARDFVITLGSNKQPNKQGKGQFAVVTYTHVLPIDGADQPQELQGLAEEAYELFVGQVPNAEEAVTEQDVQQQENAPF